MKKVFKLFGLTALVAVIGFAVSVTLVACDSATADVLPSNPSGLKASTSGGQVTLTWKESSGATSYIVYQSPYSNFSYSSEGYSVVVNRAVITLTGADLTWDRIYFRVQARNSYGPSRGYSNVISVKIK